MLDSDGQPVERGYNQSRRCDRDRSELIGLCRGLLADGVLMEQEALFLRGWIVGRPDLGDDWPVGDLVEQLQDVGFVEWSTSKEESLLDLLHSLIGGEIEIDGDVLAASSRLPLTLPPPKLQFEGRLFCFTGKFSGLKRTECQAAVVELGGDFVQSPTKKTDYLVIGEIGSTDWIQSSYGRKIEKAVENIRCGCLTAIISEQHWKAAMVDLQSD